MDTFSNDYVTPMVSNAKSNLSDKFDAIINGSFLKKNYKEIRILYGSSRISRANHSSNCK